jgi:hypothetical protein
MQIYYHEQRLHPIFGLIYIFTHRPAIGFSHFPLIDQLIIWTLYEFRITVQDLSL